MRLPGIVATFRLEAPTIKTQPQNAARRLASTAQDNCRQPLKIIVVRQAGAARARKWVDWLKAYGDEINNLDALSDLKQKDEPGGLIKRLSLKHN